MPETESPAESYRNNYRDFLATQLKLTRIPLQPICEVNVVSAWRREDWSIGSIRSRRAGAGPGERGYRPSPIKRNVKRKISPSAQRRSICLGIQPDCLKVDSYSESGLRQAKPIALSPRVKRGINGSPLWFHVAVVTAPIVFLKHNKPNRCPRDEWQHMVLSETRGLRLCSIVREGIGWIRRLACVKHGPDLDGCYFLSKSSVSRARGSPPGDGSQG
jgi:hypothetical protein